MKLLRRSQNVMPPIQSVEEEAPLFNFRDLEVLGRATAPPSWRTPRGWGACSGLRVQWLLAVPLEPSMAQERVPMTSRSAQKCYLDGAITVVTYTLGLPSHLRLHFSVTLNNPSSQPQSLKGTDKFCVLWGGFAGACAQTRLSP